MVKLGIKELALSVIGGAGSALCYLLGGYDVKIEVLAGLMVADILTGIIVAAVFKKSTKTETGALSSQYGAKGFFKKVGMLIGVAVCVMIDKLFKSDFFRNGAILYLIGNEILSITENFAVMGFKIPILADAVDMVRKLSQQKPEEKKNDV